MGCWDRFGPTRSSQHTEHTLEQNDRPEAVKFDLPSLHVFAVSGVDIAFDEDEHVARRQG
jgi:hypothetical protein